MTVEKSVFSVKPILKISIGCREIAYRPLGHFRGIR